MSRLATLPVLLAFAGSLPAADLPANITPDARDAFVAKLKPLYAKARDEWRGKAEDAKLQLKFAATAAEGKRNLAAAESMLRGFELAPWRVPGTPLVIIGEQDLKEGDIGSVTQLGEFAATKLKDGVLLEGVVVMGAKKTIERFVVASKFDPPKQVNGKPLVAPARHELPLEVLVVVLGLLGVAGHVEQDRQGELGRA